MSHFTVLVIGENPEQQLRPYQENNMGDCPEEFLKFHDVEDEYREEYKNDSVKMIRCPGGELVYAWDDRFRVLGTFGHGSNTHKVEKNDGYEEVEVFHRDRYSSFEEFMKDWASMERDKKTGKYGYWKNPNAKWDWYQLGGRYTGFFKLKDGSSGNVGSPGLMTKPSEKGWTDQARIADIDFEGMKQSAYDDAMKTYEEIERCCGGEIPRLKMTWDECLKRYPDDIDMARGEYNLQDEISFFRDKTRHLKYWYQIKEFQISKEEYAEDRKKNSCITFAVVKDSKWYERGKMGWWACVSDEKDYDVWIDEFNKLLEDLPEDTLLSVYDCHI